MHSSILSHAHLLIAPPTNLLSRWCQMSRQRIFLAVIGLFLILIVIYINRNLVHKYGPPLVHSNDRSSTRYFTKTNKLNTSPQLPLQGTTEGTTPPFPHSTESSSHNTKESTVPPTAADIKQSQSTTQKVQKFIIILYCNVQ